MDDLQLMDYFRILNPDKRGNTWRKKTTLNQGRLDYILISESQILWNLTRLNLVIDQNTPSLLQN